MDKMQTEESIDLGKLMQNLYDRRKTVGTIVGGCTLPDEDKPFGPRKKLITAIGFVIGCLISFGYGLICYKREEA